MCGIALRTFFWFCWNRSCLNQPLMLLLLVTLCCVLNLWISVHICPPPPECKYVCGWCPTDRNYKLRLTNFRIFGYDTGLQMAGLCCVAVLVLPLWAFNRICCIPCALTTVSIAQMLICNLICLLLQRPYTVCAVFLLSIAVLKLLLREILWP